MVGCADLSLVATTSADGILKIWDADSGHLIREMQFDQIIHSVIFANDQADLIVSLGGELVLVHVFDYLPHSRLQMLSELAVVDDLEEKSLHFDVDRKFWEAQESQEKFQKVGSNLWEAILTETTKPITKLVYDKPPLKIKIDVIRVYYF